MISASTLLLLPLTTTTATATSAPVTTNTFYYTASACYAIYSTRSMIKSKRFRRYIS